MKKLISAATSLAMAASMASAVVPFATGAAALKTLEIKMFNGASATISADAIAADDVKVPIGIYLKEATPTSDSISAQITVKSSNGDAKAVEFEAISPGQAKYFSEPTPFTGADGATYNITQAPGFAGLLKTGSTRDLYTSVGTGIYNADASYAKGGTDTAYASLAWVAPDDGYAWAGTSSDALPLMIVEVKFPKGTKAGDYEIQFLDYESDDKNADIMSCMIESSDVEGRKMTTKNGNLALGDPLKITVGNGGSSEPATEPPVTQPPVTQPPVTEPPVTQPPATQGNPGQSLTQPGTKSQAGAATWEKGDSLDTFIVKSGEVEVEAGKTATINVMVESGGIDVAQLVARLNDRDLPTGFTVTGIGDGISEACGDRAPEKQGEFYYINNLKTDGSAQPVDDECFVIQYEIQVDASVAPGDYEFALSRFTVATDSKNAYEAKILPGKITVNGPVTTTTEGGQTAETTTTTPVVEPTTAPTEPGTPATNLTPTYGDVNCDGKVNIADVVILCGWLNDSSAYDMKDQNKLNADCCDEKGGTEINSNDADAILQNIIDLVQLPCKSTDLKSFS